jgi:hypothetical protein
VHARLRHLPAFLKVTSVALVVAVLAALAVIAIGSTARVSNWAVAGGKHVNVTWTSDGLTPLTPLEEAAAQKHRTRDGSRLRHRKGCNCALVFWKVTSNPRLDARISDLLAGFNGCTHVTIDCCVSDASGPWMIESGQGENEQGVVDGPQYKAIANWRGRMCVRVPIGGLIDCERLHQDLAQRIADPRVRQKGLAYWLDFALGRTDPNVVTSSGLIGQCILRQPSSPLAAALRQAMRERITYGELLPNDLARAMAIEQAGRPGSQFDLTPVLSALWNAFR